MRFRWAQAVQTTCAYCRSVLVRRDLDLARVGQQADFPHTGSPIQLGTEGRWREQSFVVVGRLSYQWARGRWNEWHCRMNDGTSAWLSDAQLEYAMTQRVEAGDFRQWQRLTPGESVPIGSQRFEVSTLTRAHYLGVEGELPFTTWSREACLFVDLQNAHGAIATIDTTDDPIQNQIAGPKS